MARNSVGIEILPEDYEYAKRQDRFNCAIVRAIQRKLPEATRVMADTKTIRFTVPKDTRNMTRYVFETPKDVTEGLIKPWDTHTEHIDGPVTFVLRNAVEANDIPIPTQSELRERRLRRYNRSGQTRQPRNSPKETHILNRFVDPETEE